MPRSISGFTDTTWQERACPTIEGNPCVSGPNGRHPKNRLGPGDPERPGRTRNDAAKKLAELRSISPPRGLDRLGRRRIRRLSRTASTACSTRLPLMLVVLLSTTMLLMFLAFGSVVLPIKAAVMSALTLGSTLGILTWIFVDGHFSNWLNFTPTPLMVVLIALVVAVGLRPGHRLRGLPGVADGGGPSARHVDRRGHPDRHGDHGPPDHRGGTGPGRGRRRRSCSPTW